MSSENILSTLSALEDELRQVHIRKNKERLLQLLAPEFYEFGRSGRSYTLQEILAHMEAETEELHVHAQDFRLLMLAEGLYLLTYRAADINQGGPATRHTNRSSIWRRSADGWQMVFHQGTPTEVFALTVVVV